MIISSFYIPFVFNVILLIEKNNHVCITFRFPISNKCIVILFVLVIELFIKRKMCTCIHFSFDIQIDNVSKKKKKKEDEKMLP